MAKIFNAACCPLVDVVEVVVHHTANVGAGLALAVETIGARLSVVVVVHAHVVSDFVSQNLQSESRIARSKKILKAKFGLKQFLKRPDLQRKFAKITQINFRISNNIFVFAQMLPKHVLKGTIFFNI